LKDYELALSLCISQCIFESHLVVFDEICDDYSDGFILSGQTMDEALDKSKITFDFERAFARNSLDSLKYSLRPKIGFSGRGKYL
jgi:hypothetical protein